MARTQKPRVRWEVQVWPHYRADTQQQDGWTVRLMDWARTPCTIRGLESDRLGVAEACTWAKHLCCAFHLKRVVVFDPNWPIKQKHGLRFNFVGED